MYLLVSGRWRFLATDADSSRAAWRVAIGAVSHPAAIVGYADFPVIQQNHKSIFSGLIVTGSGGAAAGGALSRAANTRHVSRTAWSDRVFGPADPGACNATGPGLRFLAD